MKEYQVRNRENRGPPLTGGWGWGAPTRPEAGLSVWAEFSKKEKVEMTACAKRRRHIGDVMRKVVGTGGGEGWRGDGKVTSDTTLGRE